MEQYYGATLLFKTKSESITGILKLITPTHAHIEEINTHRNLELDMLDLEDIKIIKLPMKKSKQEIEVSLMQIRESIQHNVNLKKYDLMLQDCFNYFGPTENEFVVHAGEGLFNVIRPLTGPIQIFIPDDNIFDRVGFYLGRLCLNSGITVNIVQDKQSIRSCVERTLYLTHKGEINSVDNNKYEKIVLLKEIERFDKFAGVIYHCYNGHRDLGGKECVVVFGMIIDKLREYKGELYVVDVRLPNLVLEARGIKNVCEGVVTKIQ